MKHAFLTKTLLCGIMATTFFLINCQKAPSRGVRAKPGAAGAATSTSDSGQKAGTTDLVVKCSQDFYNKYTEARDAVNKLANADTTDLTDTEKEELKALEKEAREKTNTAIAAITAIDASATACKSEDGKNIYKKAEILGALDKVNLSLSEKGIETTGAEEARKRKDKARLSEGMEFEISDQLAEVLKEENVGAVYFKAGEIITKPSDETKKSDLENKKLSLCELGSGTGDFEKGEKAEVKSIDAAMQTKDLATDRYKLTVILAADSAFINFECVIADGKKDVYGEEFRQVFGEENLLTQKQVEAAKKQKEIKLENAKAIVEKKKEAVEKATKAVEVAQTAVTEKETEISEMTGDKTAATEEKDKLVKELDQLKEDLESAETAQTDAEAALKKLEDAEEE